MPIAFWLILGFGLGWYCKTGPKFKTEDAVRFKDDVIGVVNVIRWSTFYKCWQYQAIPGGGWYWEKDLKKV